MSIAIIITAILIIFIMFCVMPKQLHILEIIMIWLIVLLTLHPLSWIIYVNLSWLKVSTAIGDFWTYRLDRLILIPLLVVIVFEVTLKVSRKGIKLIILFLGIGILMLNEFLLIKLGVLYGTIWTIGHSALEKSIILLLAYPLWINFRRKLK